MKRNLCLLLVWPLLALACSSRATAADTRPNIIFILADDLGWGDLGCYGNRVAKTPNLDRLARQGALFTQFYVNSAVCSPSRAAFMTGQFPGRLGLHTLISGAQVNEKTGVPNFLDPKTPTVTKLLKDAGYATAHFGKWHLGRQKAPDPGEYGIEKHRTTTTTAKAPTWEGTDDPKFKARSTELIMDETIGFIKATKDRPFYINVWTQLPHSPLHPSEKQLEPYKDLRPDEKLPYLSARRIYYASVTEIDTQVGRLLETLDELKLAGNTVVIFSSDNGPEEIEVRSAGYSGVGSPGPSEDESAAFTRAASASPSSSAGRSTSPPGASMTPLSSAAWTSCRPSASWPA